MTASYSGGWLYLVRDRVLWFPEGEEFGIQCVARTRKRARCCNDLTYSTPFDQQMHWSQRSIGDVHDVLIAGTQGRLAELAFCRYEQQRCYVHVDGDAPDEVPPSWEVYDPYRHRRTTPRPVDLRCRNCRFLGVVDQALAPGMGSCPACGHTDWVDLGPNSWVIGKPGWRLVEAIPIDQRPVLHL